MIGTPGILASGDRGDDGGAAGAGCPSSAGGAGGGAASGTVTGASGTNNGAGTPPGTPRITTLRVDGAVGTGGRFDARPWPKLRGTAPAPPPPALRLSGALAAVMLSGV